MIWVTDAAGQNTYASPELLALTGRGSKDVSGAGWVDAVHRDDRSVTTHILGEATRLQISFSIRHRVRTVDGSFMWVMVGAAPSFGPPDLTFIGFLGSVTKICPAGSEQIEASGTIGSFNPPPPHPATAPANDIEHVADHLLIARSKAELSGLTEVMSSLDLALLLVARRLVESPAVRH